MNTKTTIHTVPGKAILYVVLAVFSIASFSTLKAQATASVNSTNGYRVNITLTAASIVAPSSCPWGYNFNTRINYNITFTGSNIPANLYTLQTYLNCGSFANFSQLPLNGGSGTVTTASNPYNSNTNCGTATVSSLNCNNFTLIIHGPGIPSQSITMYSSVALPVEFVSFTAESAGTRSVLKWKTAVENNNSYFAVERSADGANWKMIKRVEAGKNGAMVQEYLATDENPLSGLAFYRLKQVDLNGNSSFSNITTLNFQPAVTVSVYPNPATTEFSIRGENIENADIVIMDAMGKHITLAGEISNGKITFQAESLENGIYFVSIHMNGVVEKQKFTIKN